MSKHKGKDNTDAPKHPLFAAILQASNDPSPQFRDDFFKSLRQDIPDLDAIFQAQENADTPDPDYVKLQALSTQWRSQSSAYRGTQNADLIQSLHQHLPQPIVGDHPNFFQRQRHNSHLIPLVLILDNDQFQATIEGPNSKEAIALLVADFAGCAENEWTQRRMAEPELAQRMGVLLEKCDPERVAVYFLRTPEANTSSPTKLGKTAKWLLPWAQQLSTLFAEDIVPRMEPLSNASHKKQISKTRKSSPAPTQELPANGATVMLLDARKELKKLLGGTSLQGAWLNRPQVWEAVRNTSLQESFFEACLRVGAFKEEKPPTVTPTVGIDTGNTLLKGLTLPGNEVKAPTSNIAEATHAFQGYMASISHATDLSSIVQTLRESGSVHRTAILALATEAAERIGYSALNADRMMSNPGWKEAGASDEMLPFLKALNNGRWTAADIDQVFASRPLLHDARYLSGLLRSTADDNLHAWEAFSDTTIYKMAIHWAHAGNIKTTWNDYKGHLAPFEARLAELGQYEKAMFLVPHVSYNWDGDQVIGKEATQRFTRVVLNSIPDAQKEAVLKQANDLQPQGYFYYDLIPYVDGPFLQKELIEVFNKNDQRYGSQRKHLEKLARLMGYGSSFDKQTALELLSDKSARYAFGDLLIEIQQRDKNQMRNRRFSLEEKDEVQDRINLFKNMVFDLHEHLTPLSQTPVKLDGHSMLVETGVAQRGDLLAWDGFCHLVAPFLEEPRPALDAKPEAGEKGDNKPQRTEGLLLDKNTLKQQLAQGGRMYGDDWDDGWPGRPHPHAKMMRHGMHPMAMEMFMHGGFGMHMPPQMLHHMMERGMSLPPEILNQMIAQDALERYVRRDWFALPQPEVKQEAAIEGSSAPEQVKPSTGNP